MRKPEQSGEGFGDGGLPHSRQIFYQHVAVGKEGDFENFRNLRFSKHEWEERFVELFECAKRIGHGTESGSILEKVRDFARKAKPKDEDSGILRF